MDGLKKTFGKASQALTEKVGNADNLAGSTIAFCHVYSV